MKTETREIYRCDHCKKVYLRKHACVSHESKCKLNPDNEQKCFGCIFLVKKEVRHFFDTPNGTYEEQRKILYCEAKKEGVYPYWITGLFQEDIEDEIPNNPMPKECDFYVLTGMDRLKLIKLHKIELNGLFKELEQAKIKESPFEMHLVMRRISHLNIAMEKRMIDE